MSSESAFIAATDRVLAAVGAALDDAMASSDADVDWRVDDGILTIDSEDGGTVIVNRHLPNREIWVAAKSGGFHFRAEGGAWRDTRSGRELGAVLTAIVADQAKLAIALPPLAA